MRSLNDESSELKMNSALITVLEREGGISKDSTLMNWSLCTDTY